MPRGQGGERGGGGGRRGARRERAGGVAGSGAAAATPQHRPRCGAVRCHVATRSLPPAAARRVRGPAAQAHGGRPAAARCEDCGGSRCWSGQARGQPVGSPPPPPVSVRRGKLMLSVLICLLCSDMLLPDGGINISFEFCFFSCFFRQFGFFLSSFLLASPCWTGQSTDLSSGDFM